SKTKTFRLSQIEIRVFENQNLHSSIFNSSNLLARIIMISDSITTASAIASSNARDFSKKKKKKNNKSAKMKQSKLGLRREQWLSQVAVINKECKEERSDHNPVENENLRHERFMESPSSSSDISTNFSGRSSRSSSSSSSSGDITEEDNLDDGCVDDWEALADASEAEEEEKLIHESVKEQENVVGIGGAEQRSNRAWRRDDDHRPQALPNLAKQISFPELDKRFSAASTPSSCPICCEDLDSTDASFFPCPCGFKLCLFCHKTIYDGDGRCPGCRKAYERNAMTTETSFQGGCVTVRLTRSSTMFCRS
uniref:RING-type domain-containing protein n=2 Tax=Brassica oleracea var. oleracea TaxID=109376 RepID=A0A0D3AYG1_BRAOL